MSDDDLSPALHQERAHHEKCRAALARMAQEADDQVRVGEHAFASGADAEVLGRHLRSRAREVREEPDGPLFFGRLDFAPERPEAPGTPDGPDAPGAPGEPDAPGASGAPGSADAGRSHHIGRRRITEYPAAPPLVIDWRAPIARAFYQADARDPHGVARRRRFGWAAPRPGAPAELTSLEDEHLIRPRTPTAPGDGPSALLTREIERPRTGPMRDIAATLQPEQDDIVRAGPDGSLCVQGAPGTGKTAVGLHRAAYLLYTHPRLLRRGGVLVLGPDRAFLTYISSVLPSLGERNIRQSTLLEEIARQEIRAQDTPEALALKHDARMAGVLRRALRARITAPSGDLTVPDGSHRWRVAREEIERIVAGVRAEPLPYAVGRERVRALAVRAVRDLAERRSGPRNEGWARRIGSGRAVRAWVDAVWPRAVPEEVLTEVLTDPADPAFTPGERAALRWPAPPRSYRTARWTAADLLLLDEIAGLVERPAGYAHVVVDEAQDLSPMECRAVARRSASGALTVLGDLAQGTTPWAARDWRAQLTRLGRPEAPVIPLTTGYRVPAPVLELAGRLLDGLGVTVPTPRSLRRDGELTVRRVDDLTGAVVGAVRSALARPGSVGVIADSGAVPGLYGALRAGGVEADLLEEASGARVTVLPAVRAKGLEYDHVVVVEPALIAAAEERGPNRLYVVLTRAVSRLDVLHRLPLPPALERP
ncbi:AAA family ATPase [Streptomyces sp. NPDC000594]|uniref:HelD family protein n=1 Tax=Streptomyces sp. NPDC000594 TaxID=3154261 RepID=UPI00331EDC1E